MRSVGLLGASRVGGWMWSLFWGSCTATKELVSCYPRIHSKVWESNWVQRPTYLKMSQKDRKGHTFSEGSKPSKPFRVNFSQISATSSLGSKAKWEWAEYVVLELNPRAIQSPLSFWDTCSTKHISFEVRKKKKLMKNMMKASIVIV